MFNRNRIAKLPNGCHCSHVGVLNRGIVRGADSATADEAFFLYFDHPNARFATVQRHSVHQNFRCR